MISPSSAAATDTAEGVVPSVGLRVVFVAESFLPYVGGIEILSLREAIALRQLGVHVAIKALRFEQRLAVREEMRGIPVWRCGAIFVGRKLRLRFGAQWATEAALFLHLLRHRREYDVVHMRHLSFLARPVALASLLTRKPVVVQIANAGPGRSFPVPISSATSLYAGHLDPSAWYLQIAEGAWGAYDLDALRRSQWLAPLTLRLLRGKSTTLLAVSERTRTRLIEDGMRPEQIVMLPTGIEPDVYEAAAAKVEARALIDRPSVPTVLCVARYRYEKGIDYLLHAWLRVHERIPEARLILAGGGRLHAALAAMIDALGLGESVELAGERNDVDTLLGEADVFVLPSRYEGLPNALLEAMAAGLPVVATRVSGNEDVVVEGQTGWLVPPFDPDALAEALLDALTVPGDARRRGRAGRERVRAHYRRDDLMRRLVDLYRELASGQSRGDVGATPPPIGAHAAPEAPAAAVHPEARQPVGRRE